MTNVKSSPVNQLGSTNEIAQEMNYLHSNVANLHEQISRLAGLLDPILSSDAPVSGEKISENYETIFGRELADKNSGINSASARLVSIIDRIKL